MKRNERNAAKVGDADEQDLGNLVKMRDFYLAKIRYSASERVILP
jgi:hypothetical protein